MTKSAMTHARLTPEVKEEAEKICGKPAKPEFDDELVAVIKWVDGTIIDSVKKVKS